ncbi:MAG: hypothetical protein LBQ33_06680 [Oscillospiraceae bacterium]|jgi:hypothetical protein|nr:hypothetical protein [Oscillospiraceae bacterium]
MKTSKRILAIGMITALLFALCAGGAAAKTPALRTEFIRLNDVEKSFAALQPQGKKFAAPSSKGFPSDIIVVNSNHIQGIARYGKYTVASVNGHESKTKLGYLFFFDDKKLLGSITTPAPVDGGSRSHPGGIQAAGKYLAVPFGDIVALYDLSPLLSGNMPTLLAELPGGGMGSGSIGLTLYADENGKEWLAFTDCDIQGVQLLDPAALPDAQPVHLRVDRSGMTGSEYLTGDWGVNNTALVTDVNNVLYALILSSRQSMGGKLAGQIGEEGLDYEDAMVLYKIEIDGTEAKVTGPVAEKTVAPFDSYLVALGSHFRFTGTAQALDADNLAVFSSPSLPGNLALGIAGDELVQLADFFAPPTFTINAYTSQKTLPSLGSCFHRGLAWLLRLVGLVD